MFDYVPNDLLLALVAGRRGAPLRELRAEAPCSAPELVGNTSLCIQEAIRAGHKGMEGSRVPSKTGQPCAAQETVRVQFRRVSQNSR